MPNVYIKDGEIVPEGTDGAILAHAEGSEPDDDTLNQIKPGLAKAVRSEISASKKAESAEDKAEPEAENKAVDGPPANKSAGRRERE